MRRNPFRKILLLSLSLYAVIFISSCKKDNDPDPVCRISTITSSVSPTYTITYTVDGKTKSIVSGPSTTTFVYSGDSIVSTTFNNGVFYKKDINKLNAQGMTTNLRTEYTTGTNWDNFAFEYTNGTQLAKFTSTSSAGGTPKVQTYTWANGNIVSATLAGSSAVTTFEYYSDIPTQTGDYFYLSELITGMNIYQTKNALKSYAIGTNSTQFNYTITNGKITGLTATGGINQIYNYEYQCN